MRALGSRCQALLAAGEPVWWPHLREGLELTQNPWRGACQWALGHSTCYKAAQLGQAAD
jgi:hypothetical protein